MLFRSIDPKSIGVGQYQHDMNQKKLGEALGGVVEDCVNKVGVDLNTASASLLEYISGVSKAIAKNIVDYREQNGRFRSRAQLLKVPKLGPKAYEQCAGFLRILDGDNPLDATSVHPESYQAAMQLLDKMGLTMDDVRKAQKAAASKNAVKKESSGAAKKEAKPKQQKVVIRNTNTAMGKALAAAMGGMVMAAEENSSKQKEGAAQGAKADGSQAVSSLEKKIKDKKQMAEELGRSEERRVGKECT